MGGAFFNPAGLSIGNYPVTYYYTDLNTGCTNYITKYFTISNPPVAYWGGGSVTICESQAYPTSVTGGTPGGGIIAGPGVSAGHYFYPDSAGIGTHILMYIITNATTGCKDTAFKNYIVVPAPNVSWAGGTVTYCADDQPFGLGGGLPPGGSYSGTGVSNNTFNPVNAGTGSHTLTYSYMDGSNCTDNAARTFIVDPCTGIENQKAEVLKVFTDNGRLIFTQISFFESNYSVTVYNALAQSITTNKFTSDCISCVLSDIMLTKGFYYVHFSDGIKQKMFRIFIL